MKKFLTPILIVVLVSIASIGIVKTIGSKSITTKEFSWPLLTYATLIIRYPSNWEVSDFAINGDDYTISGKKITSKEFLGSENTIFVTNDARCLKSTYYKGLKCVGTFLFETRSTNQNVLNIRDEIVKNSEQLIVK